MINRLFGLMLLIVISVGISLAAQSPSQITTRFFDPVEIPSSSDVLKSLMEAQLPPITLLPQDLVQFEVFGVRDFDVRSRISILGTVKLPFIGEVHVSGMTIEEAEAEIAQRLKAELIVLDPQVNISLVEHSLQSLSVLGDVLRPGNVAGVGIHTLGETLASAGGMTDTASHQVVLIRQGALRPIVIPYANRAGEDTYDRLPVFAGDILKVPSQGHFFVLGAVKLEGVYTLRSSHGTTIRQALSLAGGIGYQAAADSAQLARLQVDGTRTMIPIHINEILKGKEGDLSLQNEDILYVPTNSAKAALKGGGAAIVVSLASAYLYAAK